MKKLLFITAPLLLSVLTASCSKSNVPPPTPLAEKPPRETFVKVIWKRKTGNGNGSLANYNVAPAYANDTVFVPNQNGMAYALAITNGKIIWKNDTGTNLSVQPNTIANAVIFGSIKGTLTAIDDKDGQTLWRTDAPSRFFLSQQSMIIQFTCKLMMVQFQLLMLEMALKNGALQTIFLKLHYRVTHHL